MERPLLWISLVFLIILMTSVKGTLPQIGNQNYALAFETVTTTLRRCGVELCYRKIEAACSTLNHYNALFRKLAFVVFCCIKKQLWNEFPPCEGLDYHIVEDDIELWEKKIRAVEAEDFAKSQVSLMSFCLHYIRSNQENIQLGIMNRLEETLSQVQSDITSSSSFVSIFDEKRSEVASVLVKIKEHTASTEERLARMKGKQKKVKQTLKHVTKVIKELEVTGEIKKFRTIDFLLGTQAYVVFLVFYLLMHIVFRNSIFERHKSSLYSSLILSIFFSLVLDSGRLNLGIIWMGLNTHKASLVLRAVVFVNFLNSIKVTIGNSAEKNRLKILQKFDEDCRRIRSLRQKRY